MEGTAAETARLAREEADSGLRRRSPTAARKVGNAASMWQQKEAEAAQSAAPQFKKTWTVRRAGATEGAYARNTKFEREPPKQLANLW